ncbi:SMP-30/gluconolactonase/LRE family protein [Geodermatophilus sp. YIM 151500]|uniref:SMP-30/gluconolactonase/LRE family protein n=1 Tax=Geodermatophilus sp. YIM 151500 TaxID=2984531 RepID=UPI0021E49F5C|nr:SMP-30/gluconolactonase/LRE family protein [Geodermatophilus sp. YIM 151500]MCV2491942.1 SMP-30/gluconolactonase/LRE family protein [Geodermatophilus sp. YIM 151500]
MGAVTAPRPAGNLPTPSQLLPGAPTAVVDLQTDEGAALVGATWRYSDARVEEIDFVEVGSPADPLGPGDVPNRTFDVLPHAEAADFDDSDWRVLSPRDTQLRLAGGRVCFNWYRLSVTLPERVGDLDPTGCTVVLEVVVDDYAEVWVDGRLPVALGDVGGQVVAGFNAPNRVLLTDDARPGRTFRIAVFGGNGPISASPRNYIWLRGATLDIYRPDQARRTEPVELRVTRADTGLDAVLEPGTPLERVAGGFEFTEGPVWTADGALLFSSPNTNTIYRWTARGAVTVFRSHAGYAGTDIGRFAQPGSNGLALDPQGRLTICQHGNRRVLRVEPHGDTTVLADRYQGKQLNSPNDLVYRSDGTLFFTDPPFGLPGGSDDPKKELPFSGVFAVRDGVVRLAADGLSGPNGIALSPDERHLYVGDWDPAHKVVVRYDVAADGSLSGGRVLFDMTGADGEDAVDGIKVDRDGNLYVCGPSGIWILTADGRHLGTLHLPESPHNLAWGDADGRGLYITALTSIYRVRTKVAGVRVVVEEDR